MLPYWWTVTESPFPTPSPSKANREHCGLQSALAVGSDDPSPPVTETMDISLYLFGFQFSYLSNGDGKSLQSYSED